MEKYEPQYMHKWKYPDSYLGDTFEEFYVFMSITRDSDILEESNWESFLRDYPEGFDWDNKKGILVERASHWAVGWVDTIYIHESDYENLKICDEIYHQLHDNYPVYDDNDFSQRESEAQYKSVDYELRYLAGRDFDIEEDLTDEQFDQMNYWFCQDTNLMESIPQEKDFTALYDRVIHLKICKTCKKYNEEHDDSWRDYEYDDRFGSCGCQIKMEL
ncbi:MAG: hypothetical protein WA061_01925 [Microgenomates group bacterium]